MTTNKRLKMTGVGPTGWVEDVALTEGDMFEISRLLCPVLLTQEEQRLLELPAEEVVWALFRHFLVLWGGSWKDLKARFLDLELLTESTMLTIIEVYGSNRVEEQDHQMPGFFQFIRASSVKWEVYIGLVELVRSLGIPPCSSLFAFSTLHRQSLEELLNGHPGILSAEFSSNPKKVGLITFSELLEVLRVLPNLSPGSIRLVQTYAQEVKAKVKLEKVSEFAYSGNGDDNVLILLSNILVKGRDVRSAVIENATLLETRAQAVVDWRGAYMDLLILRHVVFMKGAAGRSFSAIGKRLRNLLNVAHALDIVFDPEQTVLDVVQLLSDHNMEKALADQTLFVPELSRECLSSWWHRRRQATATEASPTRTINRVVDLRGLDQTLQFAQEGSEWTKGKSLVELSNQLQESSSVALLNSAQMLLAAAAELSRDAGKESVLWLLDLLERECLGLAHVYWHEWTLAFPPEAHVPSSSSRVPPATGGLELDLKGLSLSPTEFEFQGESFVSLKCKEDPQGSGTQVALGKDSFIPMREERNRGKRVPLVMTLVIASFDAPPSSSSFLSRDRASLTEEGMQVHASQLKKYFEEPMRIDLLLHDMDFKASMGDTFTLNSSLLELISLANSLPHHPFHVYVD